VVLLALVELQMRHACGDTSSGSVANASRYLHAVQNELQPFDGRRSLPNVNPELRKRKQNKMIDAFDANCKGANGSVTLTKVE
jgi:hypothetical protein